MRSITIVVTFRCLKGRSPPWSWCPYCYENRRGRANHRGHVQYQSPREAPSPYLEFILKRRQQASSKKNSPPVCCDTAFVKSYPALSEHLTDLWWEGGASREPGSLTIRMSSTEVFLSLSEPDDKASAYTTAESLTEALQLMEDALRDGTIKFKGWKRK